MDFEPGQHCDLRAFRLDWARAQAIIVRAWQRHSGGASSAKAKDAAALKQVAEALLRAVRPSACRPGARNRGRIGVMVFSVNSCIRACTTMRKPME